MRQSKAFPREYAGNLLTMIHRGIEMFIHYFLLLQLIAYPVEHFFVGDAGLCRGYFSCAKRKKR